VDHPGLFSLTVVAVILLLTALTSTVFGLYSVPAESTFSSGELGTGTATVDEVTLPDDPVITSGKYEAGQYTLRTGDAVVRLSDVTGRPFLVYKLSLDGMGYTRTSLLVLGPGDEGIRRVQLTAATIPESKVTRDTYRGELQLILRGDGPERTIAAANVTVDVQR
jgi:hypothetical protein